MEGIIHKDKLLTSDHAAGIALGIVDEQERRENLYLDAAAANAEASEKLLASRFSWRIREKDGKEMLDVKVAVASLTAALNLPMSMDEGAYRQELDDIESKYRDTERCCRAYLATHKHPLTKSGRERKRMVTDQLRSVMMDLSVLRDRAFDLYQAAEGRSILWSNVIGAVRTRSVDLKKQAIGLTAGGTGNLTVLSVEGKTLFYKEEETLQTPLHELDRYSKALAKTKKEKEILAKLKGILTDSPHDMRTKLFTGRDLITALGSEDLEVRKGAIRKLRSDLEESGAGDTAAAFEWEKDELREFFEKALPLFAQWTTRYAVAGEAGIGEGSILSERNVATSRMAGLLGISDLVAASTKVTAKDGDYVMRGNAMEQARGISMEKMSNEGKNNIVYTPEAVRKLSMLQLFDVICGQVDRKTGNIFYTAEELRVSGERPLFLVRDIQGIDHDMSFGRLTWAELNRYEGGTLQLPAVGFNGECRIPAIDEDMAVAIGALEEEQVRFALKDILSDRELDALIDRIKGVKEMIEAHPEKVVSKEHWDTAVMHRFEQGRGEKQANNAYANFDAAAMEDTYLARHEKQRAFITLRDRLVTEYRQLPPDQQVERFSELNLSISLALKDFRLGDILDPIQIRLYDAIISDALIDEVVRRRLELRGQMLARYRQFKNQVIPPEFLKEGEDGQSEEAKAEYASLMMRRDPANVAYEKLNSFYFMMSTAPEISLNGRIVAPGEELKRRQEAAAAGLEDIAATEQILGSFLRPNSSFKHVKEEAADRIDQLRNEADLANARRVLGQLLGPENGSAEAPSSGV